MDARMVGAGVLLMVLCVSIQHVGARMPRPTQFSSTCEGRGTPRMYSEVPCNLRKRSYCTEPGDMYPKHAMRRFVSDNQGLMRRMYGDLRHLSVLRSEMEWNSVSEPVPPVQRSPSAADRMNTNDVATVANDTRGDNVTTSTAAPSSQPPTSPSTTRATTSTEKPEEEKGIYACPTRQEVVAPYWAVNTRGRTLAIVNDPPYEQHIHWEKCLHENQQMLCRDGCRCEQQYRLQRLLTFDPACDCKGVFMDWFLLPSCCVCKCYGVSYNVTRNVTSGRRRGREERDNDTMIDDDGDDEDWQENASVDSDPED